MRTPTNDLRVYRYKRQPIETSYPVSVMTENGEKVINQVIPNSSINEGLQSSDFSLSSLMNAGVNPATMNINTSLNRVDAFGAATQYAQEFENFESSDTVTSTDNSDNL